jgi:hypothetical protein
MASYTAPVTFVNRQRKQIENPISTITLDDFRKAIDVMKDLNKHKTPDDDKLSYYYIPKPEVYDKMVSDQLRAVVKQRSRGNRR